MQDKIEKSIKTLKLAAEMSQTYYGKPLIITYSGGKDSDVLLHLAEKSLEPTEFEVLNSHTTVDAPQTIYHIREVFDRLNGGGIKTTVKHSYYDDGTPITMWNLIPKKGIPPTRLQRYCCSVLKESGTPNRIAALGVRADESTKRQGRDTFGVRVGSYRKATFFSLDHTEEVHHEAKDRDPVWDCTLIKVMREHGDTVVNPIYDWTDADIWKYIREEKIQTNPLYECGYKRVGCVGCPMATYKQKMKEFSDFPKYAEAYKRAFQRMVDARREKGKTVRDQWESGDKVFDWWIERWSHETKGQMRIDGM